MFDIKLGRSFEVGKSNTISVFDRKKNAVRTFYSREEFEAWAKTQENSEALLRSVSGPGPEIGEKSKFTYRTNGKTYEFASEKWASQQKDGKQIVEMMKKAQSNSMKNMGLGKPSLSINFNTKIGGDPVQEERSIKEKLDNNPFFGKTTQAADRIKGMIAARGQMADSEIIEFCSNMGKCDTSAVFELLKLDGSILVKKTGFLGFGPTIYTRK
jgi:YHS domain-containing protein